MQDYLLADASFVAERDGSGYSFTLPAPARIAMYAMLISCTSSSTALHHAACSGRVDVVQLLLSCNAAINARGRRFRPLALHF